MPDEDPELELTQLQNAELGFEAHILTTSPYTPQQVFTKEILQARHCVNYSNKSAVQNKISMFMHKEVSSFWKEPEGFWTRAKEGGQMPCWGTDPDVKCEYATLAQEKTDFPYVTP